MIPTKITRIQWQQPADKVCVLRKDFETTLFMFEMELQGKSKHFWIKHISSDTFERPWTDQESAEKYIQHQQYLAAKYGGKVLSFEIKNVD
jgi:hypothetical protein